MLGNSLAARTLLRKHRSQGSILNSFLGNNQQVYLGVQAAAVAVEKRVQRRVQHVSVRSVPHTCAFAIVPDSELVHAVAHATTALSMAPLCSATSAVMPSAQPALVSMTQHVYSRCNARNSNLRRRNSSLRTSSPMPSSSLRSKLRLVCKTPFVSSLSVSNR